MGALSKKQRQELLNDLRREGIRKYADRIRVILLLDQGWSAQKISEALFLDPSTIHRYRASYDDGGLEQLIHDGHLGKKSQLTPSDIAILSTHLEQNIHLCSKEVGAFISSTFSVQYSVSGATALLHRLGFSYRKPDPKPAKADPEAQAAFLRRLAIIRSKMKEGDHLYFADASNPQMNSMPQYGWFKKGERTTIPMNASRTRVNLFGLLDIDAQETIIRSFETINEQSVLEMIGILERKHPDARYVSVIADNASYFRSRAVKDKLSNSNVRIIHLPPYSPNLNPIERLWKYLQKQVLYNNHYPCPDDFKRELTNFCRGLRFRWDELRTLLTYRCQTFA